MAALGAPESLAEMLEIEEDTPVDFAMVLKIVHGMVAKKLQRPEIADVEVRSVKIENLPLTDVPGPGERAKKSIMHLVEVLKGIDDDFDRDSIAALIVQNEPMKLPSVLCPKKAIVHPFVMNFNIIPLEKSEGSAAKCDIIKHYVFDNPVPMQVAMEMLHGQPLVINYGSNKKAGAKPFMYLMQRMGGFTAHYYRMTVPGPGAKRTVEKPEDIDAGYDWIEDECPRSNDKNQQARWIDKQLNNADSPIWGWQIGRVEKAIRNLRDAAGHAESQHDYPLYFGHFQPWVKKFLIPIIERLDTETLMFLGCPGSGKTVSQTILGFAMSRLRIWADNKEGKKTPSIRIAPDLDCFKNEAGRKDRSTIFDDGDLDRMPARKLKNFHDAKKKSCLTTERYTSAKFVQGEFRSSADNKVDLKEEPCQKVGDKRLPLTIGYAGTSYKDFVKMIRPAFHKDMDALDIEAVLRRATVVLNTHWYVYVRPAGTKDESIIERIPLQTARFVTDDAINLLKTWWETGDMLSEVEQARMIHEEQRIFRTLLHKRTVEDLAGLHAVMDTCALQQEPVVDVHPPAGHVNPVQETALEAKEETTKAEDEVKELAPKVKPEMVKVKQEMINDVFFSKNKTLTTGAGVVDVELEVAASSVKRRRIQQ